MAMKTALLVLFMAILPSAILNAQSSHAKNIVIVHGAFADGSGWENVYHKLTRRGYNVTIVQIPLTSLEDDVAATQRAIDRQNGPVVLVGHSYGGVVITQAGNSSKVVSLVYVAAFLPDIGETALSLASILAPDPENGILPPDEKGYIYYDKAKFRSGFAAEQSPQKAGFMYASQSPVSLKGLSTPVTYAAWKTRPTYAIVATEDKSIDPGLERTMYKKANASITEIKGSHTVFMSNPKAVSAVIAKAAKGHRK